MQFFFLYIFLYCIIFWLNKNELNRTERRIRTLRLFYFGGASLCKSTCRRRSCVFHQMVAFSGEHEIVAYWAFFCVVTLLARSAQPMAMFAFDFVGNTYTEALISLPSKSLAQATSYLVAINLHDRCPSSNPTSKISHVTENRCWLWVKGNCNHLCFACPSQRRHFLVNNCSETCIRRTLEHSLRVSKTCRFFTVYIIIKKKVSQPCSVLKRWCRLKPTRIKKKPLRKKRSYLHVWVIVIPILTWLDRWKRWSNSLEVLLVLLFHIQAKTTALFQFQSTLVLLPVWEDALIIPSLQGQLRCLEFCAQVCSLQHVQWVPEVWK